MSYLFSQLCNLLFLHFAYSFMVTFQCITTLGCLECCYHRYLHGSLSQFLPESLKGDLCETFSGHPIYKCNFPPCYVLWCFILLISIHYNLTKCILIYIFTSYCLHLPLECNLHEGREFCLLIQEVPDKQ